ncbi:MAG: hypothetical protein ACREO9_12585, partial [Lysobacterales bacterium]
ILSAMEGTSSGKVLRLLAALTRQGYHLLAAAPQPTQWDGEHGNPDEALLGPNSIRKRLAALGGVLDGVYYVRHSMLTKKRNRENALLEILQRYSARPEHVTLFSSRRNFTKAARELGLQTILLDEDRDLATELGKLAEERVSPDT